MRETVFLAVGEAVASAITVAVFALLGKFDYTVLLGVLLGSLVTVGNFLFLSVSVNRTIDKILEGVDLAELKKHKLAPPEAEDGSGDEYEEDDEARKFARENSMKLNNAIKLSYMVRMATMIAALILAFLTGQFNVLATAIPLLLWRPILTLSQVINKKGKES